MLATVASMTSANRLKKHVAQYGIMSHIIQTPASLAKEGCGYSLRFDDAYKDSVSRSADDLNIKIKGFFYETQSGTNIIYNKI